LNVKQLSKIPPWEWPEDAAALVLETLTNRKAPASDRQLASEMAGEIVILNEAIADALLKIIKSHDESDTLRSGAAIALGPGLEEADLGDYDDPDDTPALSKSLVRKIQQTLHALYLDAKEPDDVRRSVLEASVRYPQDWHADAIRNAYESDNKKWLLTSVFCMRFVKGFEDKILESLKSKEQGVLCHAVIAAGNWEVDAAWGKIAQLVKSSTTEKQLRLAAIEAVASIRPNETDILEPLIDSYDEDIAEAAMDALTEAGFISGWESEDEEDEEDEED
jgi:hypothetical protein